MMRLTRKKAIELCIELWTWLAETGKAKEDWPEWKKYGEIRHRCWFCEYTVYRESVNKNKEGSICGKYCPLKVYGGCIGGIDGKDGTFYNGWDDAIFPRTRKKYAKLFLKQIKAIKK
jgi:hypothetical protein